VRSRLSRPFSTLSPTDNKHALDWRERCRANIARRARKIEDGDRIRLEQPVTFSDGHVAQEFVVCKRQRSLMLRDPDNAAFIDQPAHGAGLVDRAGHQNPQDGVRLSTIRISS
jgi:hypothetical protein